MKFKSFKTLTEGVFFQRLGLVSITKVLVMLSGILLIPIMTKTLPVHDYAIWVQILVVVGMMLPFSDWGLLTPLLCFLPSETDTKRISEKFHTVFFFVLGTSILISIIPLTAIQQTANYVFGGRTEFVYLIPFIFPTMAMNNVCLTYFRARQRIKKLSLFQTIQAYMTVGAVIVIVLTTQNIVQAIIVYGLAQMLLFAIMYVQILKEIKFCTLNTRQLRDLLIFGLPVLPGAIGAWIISGGDKIMIGIYLGITYVGYYAPAFGLGTTLMLFMTPFGTLLPATLTTLNDTDRRKEMWQHVRKSVLLYLTITIPAGILISIFAKDILQVLTTPEIASNSYNIVPIVALATIIYSGQAIASNSLIAKKKMVLLTGITLITATVFIGVSIILIPIYGLVGAATSLLIAYSVQAGMTSYRVWGEYSEERKIIIRRAVT